MTEKLERDDFAKHEGTKFKGSIGADESVEMELIEVSELQKSDQVENFSLVFNAPADANVVTGTVKMQHDELGEIDIGVSPFNQDEEGTKYEAVFSRLIGEMDTPPPTPESVADIGEESESSADTGEEEE